MGNLDRVPPQATRIAIEPGATGLRNFTPFLDSVELAIMAFDTQRRLLFINRCCAELTGFDAASVRGSDVIELFTPESSCQRSARLFAELIERGRLDEFEADMRTRDGRIRRMAFNAQLYLGLESEPLCLAFGQDLTERRNAEQALRQNEERYRLIAENIHDVVWTMDLTFRLLYISPSVLQQRGYTVEETLGMSLEQRLTPASFESACGVFARELELENGQQGDPNRTVTLELEEHCKDGSTIFTEVRAGLLRDPQGRPIGLIGVTRDVTEQRQAEMALRDSEERYRTTIDALKDLVHMVNGELRLVLCNSALVEVAGRMGFRGDPIGRRIDEVFPFLSERVIDEYRQVFRDGRPLSTVERNQIGDREYWTETSKLPMADASGRIDRVISIVRDITERKRMEHAQAAEARIEGFEVLAGGLSRRLSEQMSVILGHSAVARSFLPTDDHVYQNLVELEEAGRRIMRMAEQLKFIAAEVQPRPRQFDLTKLLAETLPELNKIVDPGWEVRLSAPPTPAAARVDPGMLTQAVLSLLINARQAAPKAGSVEVRLEVIELERPLREPYETVPPGRYVLVQVIDQGPGIDPQQIESLFVPFGADRHGQRHGVGLSIVYGILRAHSGYVRVCSTADSGTSVMLYFPSAEGDELGREQILDGGVTLTLLLALSEQHVLGMLQSVMSRAGYSVLGAADRAGLLRALEQQGPIIDLLLLDLRLLDAALEERLDRLLQISPDLRIVALSDDAPRDQARLAGRPGLLRVLPANLDAVSLLAAVDQVLVAQARQLPQ